MVALGLGLFHTLTMLGIIGAACSAGGSGSGCYLGPGYVESAFKRAAGNNLSTVKFLETIYECKEGKQSPAQIVSQFNCLLKQAITKTKAQHPSVLPLIIGGDHSCAMGSWPGLVAKQEAIGMLWIDAHLDSHTSLTSPSGALHGMPLAYLLGCEVSGGAGGGKAILDPAHTIVFGARSYENAELAMLKAKGVRIVFMDDLHADNFDAVLSESLVHVSQCPSGFGISLDLDAFDPTEAPGVSTAVGGGIQSSLFLRLLGITQNWMPDQMPSQIPAKIAWQKLVGVEIAEFNPDNDIENKTLKLIVDLVNLFDDITNNM